MADDGCEARSSRSSEAAARHSRADGGSHAIMTDDRLRDGARHGASTAASPVTGGWAAGGPDCSRYGRGGPDRPRRGRAEQNRLNAPEPSRAARRKPGDRAGPPASAPEHNRVPGWLQTGAAWSWRLLLLAAAIYLIARVLGVLYIVVVPCIAALLLTALLQPLTARLRRAGLPGLAATWVTLLIAAAGARRPRPAGRQPGERRLPDPGRPRPGTPPRRWSRGSPGRPSTSRAAMSRRPSTTFPAISASTNRSSRGPWSPAARSPPSSSAAWCSCSSSCSS